MVELQRLGWDAGWQARFNEATPPGLVPARVSAESHGIYRVLGEDGEYLARVAGRLRHGGSLPAVGDWVGIAARPLEGRATVLTTLPRRTALVRKAAGRLSAPQVLASNLDTVFLVSSLNRDFNVRRIERYLALAWESGAQPVVLLTKADLCADPGAACDEVASHAPGVDVFVLSALEGRGLAELQAYLGSGRSAAFLGSSGVGKTTLLNLLLGDHRSAVGDIRSADDRGRHTTTSRQLHLLPSGGVLIDTPGLREIQLWESETGLARAFDDLAALAQGCRFRDCRHQGEPGCAIAAAVAAGQLAEERLEHHHKLQAELRFLALKSDVQAQLVEKRRVKALCKAQKRQR